VFVSIAKDAGTLLPDEIVDGLADAVEFTSKRPEDNWVDLLWRQTRNDEQLCYAPTDFFRDDYMPEKMLTWQFDPFAASLAVIEQCCLESDEPHLPPPANLEE
jgi:hypothetical protein